ncbi:hypothetical protein EDC31_1125 [Acidomonas methanolica]|nr:hypothetical protein EDC31_1125 [Acidomonas methanolica]
MFWQKEWISMLDVLYCGLGIVGFLISLGFLSFCERI